MDSIKDVLMARDSLTEEEADELIAEAKEELAARISNGDAATDFCAEKFGLEVDYMMELI